MAHFTKMRTGFLEDVTKAIEPELAGFPEAEVIKSTVKRVIFNEAPAAEYTALLADGARWRRHQSSIKEKDELISKLQAQVSELQSSSPSLRSNGTTQTKKSPPPLDNSDIGEKFRKARDGK